MANPDLPLEIDYVLEFDAKMILQYNGFLGASPDEFGYWRIEPLPFYKDLPFLKFYDDNIPAYFNYPGIFCHLGFKKALGSALFKGLTQRRATSRSDILKAAHDHIELHWVFAVDAHGAEISSPMADDLIINEWGLTDMFREEVQEFYLQVRQNERILHEHFDNNPQKNIDNLLLVDYIYVLINLRMKKLEHLNEAVLKFNEEGGGGEV